MILFNLFLILFTIVNFHLRLFLICLSNLSCLCDILAYHLPTDALSQRLHTYKLSLNVN